MRKVAVQLLATIILLALPAPAGEAPRYNFVRGVYSLSLPPNWCVDIDADDATLTLSETPDPASPRVILAVPNPITAGFLDEYCRLAAAAVSTAIGTGQVLQEGNDGGEYGVIFRVTARDGLHFIAACNARRYGDYAILSIFVTREEDYPAARVNAALILESLRVNDEPLRRNGTFWREKATRLLRDLEGGPR